MNTKTKKHTDHKRLGSHHRHNKTYKQVYWPYLPLLALSIIVMVVSFIPRKQYSRTLAYATEMSQKTLLQATNSQRQLNSKDTLQLNDALSRAAQAKADDMVAKNYWSHRTPDGKDPWMFIDKAGYAYQKAGENLAYGFSDSQATISAWMNSETHRNNLLDTAYTEVGFGFANGNNFRDTGPETVVVAMYGRPDRLGAVTGETTSAGTTQTPDQPAQAVTKVQAMFGNNAPWAPLAVGIMSGGAITGLFINHGLRLRKFLRKTEKYFAAHPLFDISLILLIIASLELTRTVGYIN